MENSGSRSVPDTASIFSTFPSAHLSSLGGAADQVVATALLAIAVCSARAPADLPGVTGLAVLGLGLSLGYNCGCPLNPARDLAPRIFMGQLSYMLVLSTLCRGQLRGVATPAVLFHKEPARASQSIQNPYLLLAGQARKTRWVFFRWGFWMPELVLYCIHAYKFSGVATHSLELSSTNESGQHCLPSLLSLLTLIISSNGRLGLRGVLSLQPLVDHSPGGHPPGGHTGGRPSLPTRKLSTSAECNGNHRKSAENLEFYFRGHMCHFSLLTS